MQVLNLKIMRDSTSMVIRKKETANVTLLPVYLR